MSGWTIAWIVYAAIGLTMEGVALYRDAKGDTLSEHVWAIYNHPTWGKFAAWMLTAFLVWLIFHFVTRGRVA